MKTNILRLTTTTDNGQRQIDLNKVVVKSYKNMIDIRLFYIYFRVYLFNQGSRRIQSFLWSGE